MFILAATNKLHLEVIYQTQETVGTYNSTKNSGANFRKFPWANDSLFPVWKAIIVRLEFFNDF